MQQHARRVDPTGAIDCLTRVHSLGDTSIAPAKPPAMQPEQLRIALFSGNYNYVRDGANQALNRLVGYLLRQGAQVRIYSPTVENPAFEPTGDLVSVPPSPSRARRNIACRCASRSVCAATSPRSPPTSSTSPAPTSSPIARSVGHGARGIPAVASVHTRFETYLQYYHLADARAGGARDPAPLLPALRRDGRPGRVDRGDPACATDEQATSRSGHAASIAASSIRSGAASMSPRAGLADDDVVVAFLGRVVLEKGLDVFADAVDAAREAGRTPRSW